MASADRRASHGGPARLAQDLPALWAQYDAAPLRMDAINVAYEAIDGQENTILAAEPRTFADIVAVLLISTSRLYAMSSSVIDDDDGPALEMLGDVQARAVRLLADLTGCDLRSFAATKYTRHGVAAQDGPAP
ncbi:hypothetical protein MVG78_01500 [Roseomonas gilardii subsp. gilardii]|uniref:hypothetical protein n=1 Tax=Roseomonas gilardii TaxID=257708 RepID=UPI001FFC1AC0|nr:hypothetical protein [Roseomonas gilardii]UPG72901.1 hypothetical protein MVG78_01500 [Roseomonas gilardii subsp. gilardii]